MRETEKLEYLGGQVNTLLTFVAASIQAHPDPQKLRAAYLRSAELQESVTLNAAVPENYLRGQRDTSAGIEKVFKLLAEHNGP
jgi:hypothetical protein